MARRGRGGRPSLYDVEKCRAWLKAREAPGLGETPGGLFKERARRELAQALLAEQTFEMRARLLLPAEEVERTWAAEIRAVRALLLSWKTTLADRFHRAAVLNGVDGVAQEVEAAVREVLTQLAERKRTKRSADQRSPDGGHDSQVAGH